MKTSENLCILIFRKKKLPFICSYIHVQDTIIQFYERTKLRQSLCAIIYYEQTLDQQAILTNTLTMVHYACLFWLNTQILFNNIIHYYRGEQISF